MSSQRLLFTNLSNLFQIDHVVLGRGPPGGSWHRIDPDVLTLSLGSWMSLPDLPFPACTANEKRAYSRDVAAYYENYVNVMGLRRFFVDNVLVTSVIKPNESSDKEPVSEEALTKKQNLWMRKLNNDISENVKDYFIPINNAACGSRCFLTNAFNYLLWRRTTRHCKRPSNFQQESVAKKCNQVSHITYNSRKRTKSYWFLE